VSAKVRPLALLAGGFIKQNSVLAGRGQWLLRTGTQRCGAQWRRQPQGRAAEATLLARAWAQGWRDACRHAVPALPLEHFTYQVVH